MTRYYCTYFDSLYLYRAIALYGSMTRHCQPFQLFALCLDETAHSALSALNLPHVRVVALADLEALDPALAATRPDRKHYEYYWTCTPSWILDCLNRVEETATLTYLDADMFFFGNPEPLFLELDNASALLCEHRYTPQLRHLEASRGRFNVGILPFCNDASAREALAWWRERCIEWCFDAVEPGRFGDQKYLDEWPTRFPRVRTQSHIGAGVAPWNLNNYRLSSQGSLCVDGQSVLAYHFHSLRIITNSIFEVANVMYEVSANQRDVLYRPYLRSLRTAMARVRSAVPDFSAGFTRLYPHSVIGGLLFGRLCFESGLEETP